MVIKKDLKIKEDKMKKTAKNSEKTGEKEKEFDMSEVKKQIKERLKRGEIKKNDAQILEQRAPAEEILKLKDKTTPINKEYIQTGISGFDKLIEKGIPKGASILVAGGAGAGKTIFLLQIVNYHASQGKKCLYMSFEESKEKLEQHMADFGWDAKELEKKGNLLIQRFSPFDITRNIEALLAKEKGELLIDIDPIIYPKNFKPDFIFLDSLTAIGSAFTEKEDSYRIYIEQLFRFFEKIDATSFLITETEQMPKIFSTTGVEEFLADGVVVIYNLKHTNVRESAIEILKLRGTSHQKKIVAMTINSNKGIEVYPEQEVYGFEEAK